MNYRRIIKKYINEVTDKEISSEPNIDDTQDNPKDVEKFLELADQYLFKKYSKYAEKINTTKEKAMLIAALAKKWGVEASELGRVKSVLNAEGRLDEVGYDSPDIMALHYSTVLNRSAIMLDLLTGTQMDVLDRIKVLGEGDKRTVSAWLEVLIKICKGIVSELLGLSVEMEDSELANETKKLTKTLINYRKTLKSLSDNINQYSLENIVDIYGNVTIDTHEDLNRFIMYIRKSDDRLRGRF
jgi:hypothetical protein